MVEEENKVQERKEDDPIEKAIRARKELDEAQIKADKTLNELRQIATRQIIGGGSSAGSIVKEKTADDIADEMANEVIKKIYGK